MNITLNGKAKPLHEPMTVSELLKDLSIKPNTVVVELNTKIIQPDAYDTQKVSNADSMEIIRFVGGG